LIPVLGTLKTDPDVASTPKPKAKSYVPPKRMVKQVDPGDMKPWFTSLPDVDDEVDMSIVKLAKQKLENKRLSSLILAETYLNRLKAKQVFSDTIPVSFMRQQKTAAAKPTFAVQTPIIKISLDDLGGWSTKNLDHDDNLQVSTSEILHPVDAHEKMYRATWSPSASTPTPTKTMPKVKILALYNLKFDLNIFVHVYLKL